MSEAIKFPIMTEPIILVNRDGTAGQKVYQVMRGSGNTSAVVILEYPSLAPGHFKRTNISWSY
jgi:hypothetical protein